MLVPCYYCHPRTQEICECEKPLIGCLLCQNYGPAPGYLDSDIANRPLVQVQIINNLGDMVCQTFKPPKYNCMNCADTHFRRKYIPNPKLPIQSCICKQSYKVTLPCEFCCFELYQSSVNQLLQ